GFLGVAAAAVYGLVVFPECCVTGYCFDSKDEAWPFAETVPGPACDRLTAACRRHACFTVVGLLEKDGERLFNTAVLIGPDGVAGKYRKVHLPYLGVDRFTTSGDQGFGVFAAGSARVGMNICYDGAFPEAARIMALDGADVICLPTNWPPGAECTADYVINTRALENKVFFVAVNRVGTERGFPFIGKSKICDTHGNPLAVAEHTRETILLADIDLADARRKRIVRVPDKHIIDRFADRHPEHYQRLVQRQG
ncbi:MAG: nitrilase-related carbon-nitrogen hydrolase, partial [Pirellulaceae bacterium]